MKSILSIQSHVAFGYVGNRAAVFPLQRLGFDVTAVNTVQFSNHTGYGSWTGQAVPAADLAQLIDGIEARGALAACDGVLSGYLGTEEVAAVVLDAVTRVRALKPAALWCCDPVIGDVGRGVFVRPGIPELFRDRLVPAADIVTPNQFELEFLTGHSINTLADALAAADSLRARGPKLVLVTSLVRHEAPAEAIEMLVAGPDGAWLVATPRLPLEPPPNGAGDCVAALFLAHTLSGASPAEALARVAGSIYGLFDATRRAGTRELQLIAAQDELVTPSQRFEVRQVR